MAKELSMTPNAIYLRERYTNPEVREKKNAKQRERYTNPEVREKKNAKQRERLANPEVREKENAKQRERRANPEVREKKNAKQRERLANPEVREKMNAKRRERRANPEVREKNNIKDRERRANPEVRDRLFLSKYGISEQEKYNILAAQSGVCAVSGVSDPGSKYGWATDHHHDKGHVRGVVSHYWNTTIGQLGDTYDEVKKSTDMILAYLLKTEDGCIVDESLWREKWPRS